MNKIPAIDAFYSSWEWRKCRASFMSSKGNLCEICRDKGLIVPAVHVHHKKHITATNLNDPTVTLSFDNLMALCEECHHAQHRREKRWRVDEDGHVTPGDPP